MDPNQIAFSLSRKSESTMFSKKNPGSAGQWLNLVI